ncbi:MAG: DUF3427 domain-containing protein [Succinivibrio sp.]|nr:DUF3427 domain-containing protein [Succinivibrio sp.]
MGATDLKAIVQLSCLRQTEIYISYEERATRHHAKAYIFRRRSGFGTAYIGSSNISSPALGTGLEWNLKVTEQELPDVFKIVTATFESYQNDQAFERFDHSEQATARLREALRQRETGGSRRYQAFFDLRPYWYQQEILDRLEAERELHRHFKNLVVAATGTGKTLIAAFDYRRCAQKLGHLPTLLFVAHRKEILEQAQATFQMVLKDPNFGELCVGDQGSRAAAQLFITVQSAGSRVRPLTGTVAADFFEYMVVDESHHASAESFRTLIEYFQPKILLGLTATPERLDGQSITRFFDEHISAEIRLPEAIEKKLLCPFAYFGVSDNADLQKLRWSHGNYDLQELENIYTLDQLVANQRVDLVINSLERYVADPSQVHCLGFCCTQKHASFMAGKFQQAGFRADYLTGELSSNKRASLLERFRSGALNYLFVVDIVNEGVDIPSIDTVLFLRPTQSLTVFIQQLGRGLRLCEGKECLTVLDFVGQANREYRFAPKFEALLYERKGSLADEIKKEFPHLPNGCFVQLEKKAREVILENIRAQILKNKAQWLEQLRLYSRSSPDTISLRGFLDFTGRSLEELCAKKISFKRLCAQADLSKDFTEPLEEQYVKALPRLCQINSPAFIHELLSLLPTLSSLSTEELLSQQHRYFGMFYVTLYGSTMREDVDQGMLEERLKALKHSPVLTGDLAELLQLKLDALVLVPPALEGYDCPLQLHCSYSRDQLLVGLGLDHPSNMREGVKYLKERRTDVLLVTLNKSEKEYSPSTMYDDFSINERQFHWQSQSTVSEQSDTARRYIGSPHNGNTVLLFVREFKQNSLGSAPYTFLGKVSYRCHEGSRPVTIIWDLETAIPAFLLKKTNKLLVG